MIMYTITMHKRQLFVHGVNNYVYRCSKGLIDIEPLYSAYIWKTTISPVNGLPDHADDVPSWNDRRARATADRRLLL